LAAFPSYRQACFSRELFGDEVIDPTCLESLFTVGVSEGQKSASELYPEDIDKTKNKKKKSEGEGDGAN